MPDAADKKKRNLVPLLAATTAIFLVTTVLFGLMALAPGSAPIQTGSVRQAAQSTAEREVEDVAARFMTNLLNYSHDTVEEDVGRALQDVTDDFLVRTHAVLEGRDVEGFKQAIVEREGVGTARVLAAATTSRDGDTATVVTMANRTFDSNRIPQPREELLGVELTLVQTADGWKVDAVSPPATT